jgi:hypothetical protein
MKYSQIWAERKTNPSAVDTKITAGETVFFNWPLDAINQDKSKWDSTKNRTSMRENQMRERSRDRRRQRSVEKTRLNEDLVAHQDTQAKIKSSPATGNTNTNESPWKVDETETGVKTRAESTAAAKNFSGENEE